MSKEANTEEIGWYVLEVFLKVSKYVIYFLLLEVLFKVLCR